jgi:hypothetical protein
LLDEALSRPLPLASPVSVQLLDGKPLPLDILAALKREERKLEKQLGKLSHQLTAVRAAAKALGHSTKREIAA